MKIEKRQYEENRTSEKRRILSKPSVATANPIKGINTWAVPLVRYSRPFLKWTREELRQMYEMTRINKNYARGFTSER